MGGTGGKGFHPLDVFPRLSGYKRSVICRFWQPLDSDTFDALGRTKFANVRRNNYPNRPSIDRSLPFCLESDDKTTNSNDYNLRPSAFCSQSTWRLLGYQFMQQFAFHLQMPLNSDLLLIEAEFLQLVTTLATSTANTFAQFPDLAFRSGSRKATYFRMR